MVKRDDFLTQSKIKPFKTLRQKQTKRTWSPSVLAEIPVVQSGVMMFDSPAAGLDSGSLNAGSPGDQSSSLTPPVSVQKLSKANPLWAQLHQTSPQVIHHRCVASVTSARGHHASSTRQLQRIKKSRVVTLSQKGRVSTVQTQNVCFWEETVIYDIGMYKNI